MKATGIVRRIDDLGRVVIPKEIRRTMRIREGDPLEIYTDADGEVIFKKYSQVGELSSLTAQYAEVLHKNTGLPVVITDRDRVISCAGVPKKETVERRITQALENIMENRSPFICEEGGERFHPIEGVERDAAAAFPIIGAGDVSGAVVLLTAGEASVPTQTEIKLVQVAASFLGKHLFFLLTSAAMRYKIIGYPIDGFGREPDFRPPKGRNSQVKEPSRDGPLERHLHRRSNPRSGESFR